MSGQRALAVLALLWLVFAAAGEVTAGPAVDLSEPGALEALRLTNPTHHAKVWQILDGVLARPDAEVPRWMQASFDARDVSYVPVVMTSYPPKRRFSFALDATRYEAILTLTNVRGAILPAR